MLPLLAYILDRGPSSPGATTSKPSLPRSYVRIAILGQSGLRNHIHSWTCIRGGPLGFWLSIFTQMLAFFFDWSLLPSDIVHNNKSSTSRIVGLHCEHLSASMVIYDFKQLAISSSENGATGTFRWSLRWVHLDISILDLQYVLACSLHKHIYVATNLLLFLD